ncbi:MAG TPA: hypothetical protein PLH37_01940 [bacterium]|nr:hypothetical protein [bacterium]
MKLIFSAFSKHLFYFRMHISKYILENNNVPLNPFMIHEYFMLDTIARDKIRESNNLLVEKADELWVFGDISNGVLAEIELAKTNNKPIRYFQVIGSKDIKEITAEEAKIEHDLE